MSNARSILTQTPARTAVIMSLCIIDPRTNITYLRWYVAQSMPSNPNAFSCPRHASAKVSELKTLLRPSSRELTFLYLDAYYRCQYLKADDPTSSHFSRNKNPVNYSSVIVGFFFLVRWMCSWIRYSLLGTHQLAVVNQSEMTQPRGEGKQL